MILDSTGRIVFYQPLKKNESAYDYKIQPGGLISYFKNNQFYIMDSSLRVIDSVKCGNGYITDWHEMRILPNGHYLLLATEMDTMDLSQYHYFKPFNIPGSRTARVFCGIIQELDQNKKVVFEWHAKDHYKFSSVDPFWMADSAWVDWTHFNALEMDSDGNILVSSRYFNEITKINRTTGDIIWRLGGRNNQFKFLNDNLRFYGQHYIRRLPNGHYTLFDNGNYYTPHGARAVEYELDEKNKTVNTVWSYTYDPTMPSYAMGSVQRLNDGNTLVSYGVVKNYEVSFALVSPDSQKHFELAFNSNVLSYRVSHIDSFPWKLNKPAIFCFDSAGRHYLDAGPGYTSYLWQDGRAGRVIEILREGNYQVKVPYGEGFLYSDLMPVKNIYNPCGTIAISGIRQSADQAELSLFPNPAGDELTLRLNIMPADAKTIMITDVFGKTITRFNYFTNWQNDDVIRLPVSTLRPGVYFLHIGSQYAKFVKK
jgi:hypothetical protein